MPTKNVYACKKIARWLVQASDKSYTRKDMRKPLTSVTPESSDAAAAGPLVSYSRGLLARNEAIRLLGLRDYAGLLVALGNADLPMPMQPPHEIESQADTFVGLWGDRGDGKA